MNKKGAADIIIPGRDGKTPVKDKKITEKILEVEKWEQNRYIWWYSQRI